MPAAVVPASRLVERDRRAAPSVESRLPSGPGTEEQVTVTVQWERDGQRMELCDHAGTTEPLDGSDQISTCTECAKTWPQDGAAAGMINYGWRYRGAGALGVLLTAPLAAASETCPSTAPCFASARLSLPRASCP